MKKFLIVMIAVVMLFTFSGCSDVNFYSKSQLDKLVADYGTPQVKMTVEYNNDRSSTDSKGTNIKLELVYDLHLDKAPMTSINFIGLVTSGLYDNTVFSSKIGSTGIVAGNYSYNKDDKTYKTLTTDYTIKGEFLANDWILPDSEGNATVKKNSNLVHALGSLAMYHSGSVKNFDQASHAFYMTLSSTDVTRNGNYAVFATLSSCKVTYGTLESKVSTQIPADVLADFVYFTTLKTDPNVDGSTTNGASILEKVILISKVEMVGDKDYTKLLSSHNYKILA
ncbi:MAG: peptidylprolyl isomerase [Clostridia bacterium]